MQLATIYRGEHRLAQFDVTRRPIEIGSALGCDIVLDDPELCPRHWLLTWSGGTLVAHDVSAGKRHRARSYPVAATRGFPLGRDHVLRRGEAAGEAPAGLQRVPEGDTVAAERGLVAGGLVLLVGTGAEARRIALDDRPLHIGRGDDNDVVITDRSVSQRHCRLEPHPEGVVLRDLGSRNGTFVAGVRVSRVALRAGACLRVGRTDLRLVARSPRPGGRGPDLVAESPAMLGVLEEARSMAALPWALLVRGESGTGKEGVAMAVHELGPRGGGPFVALNAGGLTPSLIESELFGHERGAFSGAETVHRGVFEQAHGGTLFLDEIGELPPEQQARLLRVLETGEVRRVGSERLRRVDVRLVCATHRDLRGMVADGSFRQDLYYRVARLVIEVPALRARPTDIRALARHFLTQMASEVGPRDLSEEAEAQLVAYPWPGNVRELRNVLCSASASSAGGRLERTDVMRALHRIGVGPSSGAPSGASLREIVATHGGNLTAAARALGMPRSTLRGRLRVEAR